MNNLGTDISDDFVAEIDRLRSGIGWKQFEKRYGVGRQTFHSWKSRRVANRQILADMLAAIWKDQSYGRPFFGPAVSALPPETQQALRPLLAASVEGEGVATGTAGEFTAIPHADTDSAGVGEIDGFHTPARHDADIAPTPDSNSLYPGLASPRIEAKSRQRNWRLAGAVFLPLCFMTVISMAFAFTRSDPPQGNFTDTFEFPQLNEFWQKTEDSGNITLGCHEVDYAGPCAKFTTVEGDITKRVRLMHKFDEPIFGRISVSVYDTGADMESSNYISLIAWNSQKLSKAAVGTKDYDLGPEKGSTYIYQNFTDGYSKSSEIDRTRDWHRFTIISRPGYLNLLVDGNEIYRGTEGTPFDEIEIELRAPHWRPPWHAYFAEFTFVPYEAEE